MSTSQAISCTCYEWAVKENPCDGEALFWVGFFHIKSARQAHDKMLTPSAGYEAEDLSRSDHMVQQILDSFNSGIHALEIAANNLDPCNVRTLAYLSSAYSWRWCFALQTHPCQFALSEEKELQKAATMLKRAVYLEGLLGQLFGDFEGTTNGNQASLLQQLEEILLRQRELKKEPHCQPR